MLRTPSREEAKQYIGRAYHLALDPSSSGYPLYTDGIKTKTDFEKAVLRTWDGNSTDRALLYEEYGKTAGLICFFLLPRDRYLQTGVFSIEGCMENALTEFEAYCCREFPGYEWYLGFPEENQNAVTYLSNHEWILLERSYHNVCRLADCSVAEPNACVSQVTRQNYSDFRNIHQICQGDMYWNCERLYDHFSEWTIWLYRQNSVPNAAIYYTNEPDCAEIFGVDFPSGGLDENALEALISAVQYDCKQKECRYIVFMTDIESRDTALKLGFQCVGQYLLFRKKP